MPHICYNLDMGTTVMSRESALSALSRNLQAAMDADGISVRQLSIRSHVHAMVIHRVLHQANMPAADAVARIARALGVSIDSLFAGADIDPPCDEENESWENPDNFPEGV